MSAAERLPSTRELAEQLHVSRTVEVLAYEQLLAEGFVVGRAGSGTYVADVLADGRTKPRASRVKIRLSRYARAAGARILPVPVDRDGLDPDRLPDRTRMVFVTPSHQFPTGVILSPPRRLNLVDWARRMDALAVEDDYDGEYRYEDQSLQSLQGLDAEGRVIYIGTFSRTVFSALRIGYLIVPKPLISVFTSAKWLSDRHTATLEQETLAEFITSGLYERHLRRVRRRNAARRETLREAIAKYLSDRVEVTGFGAGAHVEGVRRLSQVL
jgi:DNA-binding transcriptional MocR family regulator